MSTQVKLKHSFTPLKDMECKLMLKRTQRITIHVIWSKSLKLCLVSSKKLSLWKHWRRLWGFCGMDGLVLQLKFDTRSSRRWPGWSFWLYWKGLRATFLGIRLLLDLGFCLTLLYFEVHHPVEASGCTGRLGRGRAAQHPPRQPRPPLTPHTPQLDPPSPSKSADIIRG